MRVFIDYRKKSYTFDVKETMTIGEFKQLVAKDCRIHRQGFIIGHLIPVRQAMKIMITEKDPLRLSDDRKTFADYDIKMDAHIILRDIGPQIGYRNVCVTFSWLLTYRCLSLSTLDLLLSCSCLP